MGLAERSGAGAECQYTQEPWQLVLLVCILQTHLTMLTTANTGQKTSLQKYQAFTQCLVNVKPALVERIVFTA